MEITGKIFEILPSQSGKSARGEWKKQEFIIETQEQFPRKICFANWNAKVDLNNVKKGTSVKVFFDIESREYNGKWFTDAKAWKMDLQGQEDSTVPDNISNVIEPDSFDNLTVTNQENSEEDLPF
ncbi:MAG: DUF3127 domain-containing protein [Bacteroidia bacterium]|nr:DUF3127 domain-containing protein [Bacteroidia bacterium]